MDLLAHEINPEDFEDEEAFDAYLMELAERFPADLNTAPSETFYLIPGIRHQTVRAILAHRRQTPFQSVDDLRNVSGMDPGDLEALLPWVAVESYSSGRRLVSEIAVEQLFRYQRTIPRAQGYRATSGNSAPYPGSPGRLYHRQSVRGERVSANLTQAKLPGEQLSSRFGPDFTSGHLQVSDIGPMNRLVIGDYSLRFGQGLALWSTASFGKSGTAHSAPRRRTFGITPYRSSGQIRFFRGVAMETDIINPAFKWLTDGRITVTLFHSERRRSAVQTVGDTIRPPSSSPYHRTYSQRSRRHNTKEFVTGGNIRFETDYVRAGITRYTYRLNRPVTPLPGSHIMRGQDHGVNAADFSAEMGPLQVFGEFALRDANADNTRWSQRSAWTAGISGSFAGVTDWIWAARWFQPMYWSEFGNAFGEGSSPPANQTGWYFGYRIRTRPGIVLSGFLDRFRFPEPRGHDTLASDGWETAASASYRPFRTFNIHATFRYKERSGETEANDVFGRAFRVSTSEYRYSGRIRLQWRVRPNVLLLTWLDRSETASTASSRSSGVSLSQVFRWQVHESVQLDISRSVFETDDFSSRIYIYEYGLTQTMNSRMVFGKGLISSVVIRYQPMRWLLAETHFSVLRYIDRPAIGSGNELTGGPARSHAGVQLRLRY
ncbi:helix-hairpin-helix domain-containing protein [Balneolales bacterium ANBcel1]|nr:helix-hairpin-helix domain-containing protein [Balneolales bacterium ANBcel1]